MVIYFESGDYEHEKLFLAIINLKTFMYLLILP